MDLGLRGHRALVTGAASGIGRAVAEAFASEGCAVTLWDVNSSVRTVADEIGDQFAVQSAGAVVDVSDEAAVRSAMTSETRLDHLVHSAAVGSGKFGFPFTKLEPADWARCLTVNVLGMVHVAHAATETLLASPYGTMVFIGSVAGQIGSQTDPPYSATKAANINFAQCMAKDLAPRGVRVNTVCPGMVQTPLNRAVWKSWFDQVAAAERLDYDTWAAEKIANVVPLRRWQTPESIANMVVFLSSERAGDVTGQTINVDGGYVMHS